MLEKVEYQYWSVEIDLANVPDDVVDNMFESCPLESDGVVYDEFGTNWLRDIPLTEDVRIMRFSGRKEPLERFLQKFGFAHAIDRMYMPHTEITVRCEQPPEDEEFCSGNDMRVYSCAKIVFLVDSSRTTILEEIVNQSCRPVVDYDGNDVIREIDIDFEKVEYFTNWLARYAARLLECPTLQP